MLKQLCQLFQRQNSGTFYEWMQAHAHATITHERELPRGYEYTVAERGHRYVVLTDRNGQVVEVTG